MGPERGGPMRELTDEPTGGPTDELTAEPTGGLTADELLRALEPAAAAALDRHLAVAPEWFPHEHVPWGRGRDYAGPGGEPWAPEQSSLDPAVRAAFELNLLT